MLLPDRLREVWGAAEAGRLSQEAACATQERLLEGYRSAWRDALLVDGDEDLRTSLLREVAAYYEVDDLAEVERRCTSAVETMRHEWEEHIDPQQRAGVESFYQSATMVYDLMNWHSLRDDTGPLAYVLGLEIARAHRVRTCLDFGSGVGSGALLFTRDGISMTLADISTTLLNFAHWRFARRELSAHFLDLNQTALPTASFDMILAMDVFEHLVDPADTAEHLWRALRPGGLLFARIHVEDAGAHPQHIVRDFSPTFARMHELGLVQTWQDTWLWGHHLFEKRRA
ncbi:MAG TPA: class I SAM-dependent methyltransferase [Candidatus Binatia bacterium]|jgi:2-polyprenyl-3-methyl-5-hydroxy-6-metoxy-1,4-benzoquinol methylase|nr:class I SAM-dependent methyltransferase [Candidatus Binatia bacterium]